MCERGKNGELRPEEPAAARGGAPGRRGGDRAPIGERRGGAPLCRGQFLGWYRYKLGRGGSSFNVLASLPPPPPVCVRARFCERHGAMTPAALECVIMTSMFLYGVEHPGGSEVPLSAGSDPVCVSLFDSESLQ